MMITPKQRAPRAQFAKNHTPYIVENQWYSSDFTQKIAIAVSENAAIGMPKAAVLRFIRVQLALPSESCVNEALRSRAEIQIHSRNEPNVTPKNILVFRKP